MVHRLSLRKAVIRKHVGTGLMTWFGNLTSAYGRSKFHGATQPPYLGDDGSYHPPPLYGDGTTIETKYLELALQIAESSQVMIKWEQGDIVLLDVSQHTFSWWAMWPWHECWSSYSNRIMQWCTLGHLGKDNVQCWRLCGIRMVGLMTLRREGRSWNLVLEDLLRLHMVYPPKS